MGVRMFSIILMRQELQKVFLEVVMFMVCGNVKNVATDFTSIILCQPIKLKHHLYFNCSSTNMTDKIKQKIQELVPEVMELRLGCKIEYNDGIYFYHSTDYHGAYNLYGFQPNYIHAKAIVGSKILGSPLTLAVVLRAINGGQPFSAQDQAWCDDVLNLLMHERGAWNLAKDNYGEQSPETKAFIGQLLGVSE